MNGESGHILGSDGVRSRSPQHTLSKPARRIAVPPLTTPGWVLLSTYSVMARPAFVAALAFITMNPEHF